MHGLSPTDAPRLSLRVFPHATHIFDDFVSLFEYPDPAANRRQSGTIHVHPNPEAREQARDDLVRFFAEKLKENSLSVRSRI